MSRVPSCQPFSRTPPTKIKDWTGAAPCDHIVQFYRTDDYLVECLAGYVADGIWNRDSVIIIATPEHRIALEARLRMKGVDVISTTLSRQYLAFDAREMLRKFMVHGRPHPESFEKVLEEVLRTAAAGGKRIRAFGEMVALLWAEDNRAGALELEQLWNKLSREHAFTLYCAYPSAAVESNGDGPTLEHICDAHSCVIAPAG